MPNLGENRKIDLSSKRKKPAAEEKLKAAHVKTASTATKTAQRAQASKLLDDVDNGDDDEDDDEVINAVVGQQGDNSKDKIKFIIGGSAVVLVVVLAFVLLRGAFNSAQPSSPPLPNSPTEPSQDQQISEPENPGIPDGMGTQNFLQNTTMDSSSSLSDPENFVKDLYGLTTQVNYTVASIGVAADFVNYTKHRGTWGGGLELYYLDCEYKGTKYVVQVPFQYYKELDETGIVPVKMEVLRIKGDTSNDYLTVISYMQLDAETLRSVLKAQAK